MLRVQWLYLACSHTATNKILTLYLQSEFAVRARNSTWVCPDLQLYPFQCSHFQEIKRELSKLNSGVLGLLQLKAQAGLKTRSIQNLQFIAHKCTELNGHNDAAWNCCRQALKKGLLQQLQKIASFRTLQIFIYLFIMHVGEYQREYLFCHKRKITTTWNSTNKSKWHIYWNFHL